MKNIPDISLAYEYENSFYLTSAPGRLSKALAHFKLLEMVANIEGDIFEFGVFKGASFCRFASYRKILNLESKNLVGFDSFGEFPSTEFEEDKALRERFIDAAGLNSISTEDLLNFLESKNCSGNIELIKGDITQTSSDYLINNPDQKICLLNLDVDIYEPTKTVLDNFYEKISTGGILILDDYLTFPGETKAIEDFIQGKEIKINPPLFDGTPYFIKKL